MTWALLALYNNDMANLDYTVDSLLHEFTRDWLRRCGGNRTEAAKHMGISLRTLRNWIRKWKLYKEFPARSNPVK